MNDLNPWPRKPFNICMVKYKRQWYAVSYDGWMHYGVLLMPYFKNTESSPTFIACTQCFELYHPGYYMAINAIEILK